MGAQKNRTRIEQVQSRGTQKEQKQTISIIKEDYRTISYRHLLRQMTSNGENFSEKARVYVMIGFGRPAMAFPETFNSLFPEGQVMITHSFDPDSGAIITPASLFGEQKKICDIAIATFSREIYSAVLERYPNEQISEISAANRIRPVHLLTLDADLKAVFYLSEIGSALAGTDVIEVNWKTGANKFILFGSAGALDQEATAGKYVIPTAAYRDEGMSYHYAPPSDYISIPKADYLEGFFAENHLPFVKGKVWTTDALYMETRELVRRRKADGCIAVEMELAGVQAVCNYHGLELYDFLVTGDVVDQQVYSPEGLTEANHSFDKFDIAAMIAKSL